jgi:hypothetical protein
MNRERYTILQQAIENGRFTVNLDTGLVYGKKGNVVGSPTWKGYLKTTCTVGGKKYSFMIHEIVATAGGLDIIGKEVNHVDKLKSHNWFSNLEPMSQLDNIRYSAKLTLEQVREIRRLWATGNYLQRRIAEEFEVVPELISMIVNNKVWREVV